MKQAQQSVKLLLLLDQCVFTSEHFLKKKKKHKETGTNFSLLISLNIGLLKVLFTAVYFSGIISHLFQRGSMWSVTSQ